jgi:hypothetical protein
MTLGILEQDLFRQLALLVVITGYTILLRSTITSPGHVKQGMIAFVGCNILAIILFGITGFQNLNIPNYITVVAGVFGIFLGFYTLYRMEGDTMVGA